MFYSGKKMCQLGSVSLIFPSEVLIVSQVSKLQTLSYAHKSQSNLERCETHMFWKNEEETENFYQ